MTDDQPDYSDKISQGKAKVNSTEFKEKREQNNETYEDRDSPIIYQRESF